MFLKLFKRNSPFDYPVLLIYTFLLHGILFFKPSLGLIQQHSFLNSLTNIVLWNNLPIKYVLVLSVFAVFVSAIIFNRLLTSLDFFQQKNMLPAFIYITLSGFFPSSAIISNTLITFWVMLFILFEIFKILDMENVVQKVFFLSLLLGFFSFIYFPLGYYLPFIFISVPLLKSPKLRELLIIPVGYTIPFYLIGLYFFFIGRLDFFWPFLLSNFYLPEITLAVKFNLSSISLFYLTFLIIIAYLNFKFQASNILVRFIRFYNVLFLYFLFTLAIVVFIPSDKYLSGYFFIIPVSVYLSNFFCDKSYQKIKEIMFLLMLLAIVLSQWWFYIS